MRLLVLNLRLIGLILSLSVFHSSCNNETIPYSSIFSESQMFLSYTYLHKCKCAANQAIHEKECVGNSTSIQALIDGHSSTTKIINTNLIEKVIVEELKCPANHLSLTLPGDKFALQTSGKLFILNYGLTLNISKYCVEHFLNDEESIMMKVQLCLPVPVVPKCCPDNLYDSFTNECSDENNTDIVVPFTLGTSSYEMETKSFPNILQCQEGEDRTHISISQEETNTNLKLTNEGLILSHQISVFGDVISIPSPEYCLEAINQDNYALYASYCYKDPLKTHLKACKNATCYRKCCPTHQVYDMDNLKCVSVIDSNQWTPTFYHHKYRNEIINETIDFKLLIGFPLNCQFFSLSPINDPPDQFKLLSNGSLYVQNWDLSLFPYQYCIDNFKYKNEYIQESLVCFLESKEPLSQCEHIKSIMYPILLLISCLFLAITLVVYAIIPDLHAKVQGKCLIASISALLSAYICFVTVQLSYSTLSIPACIAFGLLIQFSLLASFFWLNVMCFDIWRTLRSMQTGRESPSSARRRYLLYSLYAWGCPLIIVIVTLVMQVLPASVDKTNLIIPRFGESRCFFPIYDNKALWVYLYGFISVILVVNTLLFIHLAWILVRAQKISESALGKKNQLHKEWAKLYLKLFLIMGITWIFEAASWIKGSCGFWVLTDIINSLRGLLIFIIFVCKKDVIRKLLSESSPAFHRMTTTVRQTSFFSRSSKRTSNFFVDPTSVTGANGQPSDQNHHDMQL